MQARPSKSVSQMFGRKILNTDKIQLCKTLDFDCDLYIMLRCDTRYYHAMPQLSIPGIARLVDLRIYFSFGLRPQ